MDKAVNLIIILGVLSIVFGVILRLMAKAFVLGLFPSSFLAFSSTCFLLAIALKLSSKK